MDRPLLTLVLSSAVALLAFARTSILECIAAEPATSTPALTLPADAVIVLQDGGVLAGRVSHSDDRYIIARDTGELNVSANKVKMVCRSLEEAYEQQRRQFAKPTLESHLSLADWCLRYNLLPQAARELIDARGLDPRHPKIKLLERRLAVAGQPPRAEKPQTAAIKESSPPAVEKPAPVRHVAKELPSTNELSSVAVEQFTRKVQPILVNNCSTAGCHQLNGPQQFQLDRAVLHGMSNRKSTFQNLEAALALVDHESPQLSPLLTVPRHSHGGMDHAVFGPRQGPLIARLSEWVAVVTNTVPVDETGTVATSEETAEAPAELPLVARRGAVPIPKPAAGVPKADVAKDSGVVQASYEAEDAALAPAPKLRYGAQVRKQPWRPKDPFDAEIFNRQSPPAPANNLAPSPSGRGPR